MTATETTKDTINIATTKDTINIAALVAGQKGPILRALLIDTEGKTLQPQDFEAAEKIVIEFELAGLGGGAKGTKREQVCAALEIPSDSADVVVMGALTKLLMEEKPTAPKPAAAPRRQRTKAAPAAAPVAPPATATATTIASGPFDPAAPKRFGPFTQVGDRDPSEPEMPDDVIAKRAAQYEGAVKVSDTKVAENIAGILGRQGYKLEKAPEPVGATS